MIKLGRKRLAVIAVVAIVIVVAVAWGYYLSPVKRDTTLINIKELAIRGLLSGAVYALLALGFTLIYGVADVVNMAHGAFYMLGAYIFSIFLTKLGYNLITNPSSSLLIIALILAPIFVGFVGIIIYRLLIHPIIENTLSVLVVTIGTALILQQIVVFVFGDKDMTVPTDKLLDGSMTPLGVTVTYYELLRFVLSLGLIAILWIFITRSKIGGAMRATAQDREAAMLMGINTGRLYMLTMAISALLAATSGILLVPPTASPMLREWTYPLIMSFAIVILGGLGSIKGSLVGAFIIGYVEKSVLIFFPGMGFLKEPAALIVMVLVLLFRPKGIFGKRVEAE